MSDVTRILNSLEKGDLKSADELLPLVYDELRKLSAYKMAKEAPGQTLQATALVHEAFLRLVGKENQRWENSRHFFFAAAEAMRRILVETARRKARKKYGGDLSRVHLDDIQIPLEANGEKLIHVHEALDKLATEDQTKAEIVKLYFFVGLNFEEIGRALKLSVRTVRRYWNYSKVWLFEEIESHKTRTKPQA